ncbi:hypothetical protein [Vibrio sp. EA2]|uniref:hypothetical protein n=1 Tax=Vibrio sp. EA2 TaxID=3079860 RepID=UPI002949D59E|nr:hypothetical protein [Vibrio sp. EA2]MDV6253995.1 hypothetical protein [Vibrio sp. EA2]
MAWLETLLAFAVTMMVLSTITSAIVEAFNSLLNHRVKGLERLMQEMFDKVISPKLGKGTPNDLTRANFVNQMTSMRLEPVDRDASTWKKVLNEFVNKFRRADKLQSLTTLEFFERFAESPFGKEIHKRSGYPNVNEETLNVLLEDIANKFEAFGDEATKYFARRARVTSVLFGFILVFSINFSSVEVVKFLVQSEESRAALIKQGEKIANDLNAQLKRTEESIVKATSGNSDLPAFDAEELGQSFSKSLRALKRANLPIGWEHLPWKNSDTNMTVWKYLAWFFSVFAAGLLVGFGGPFWFDFFHKLSALSRVSRVFKSEVMQDGAQAITETPQERRNRLVDVFKTARAASDFAIAAKGSELRKRKSAPNGRT